MDKNGIKKFAVWARKELLERVRLRALHYGVSGSSCTDGDRDEINGRLLTDEERAMRFELLAQVQAKGYEQVMEEAAYTWFNRFCAVRFMEVNGYLPSHVRVFTDEENRFRPQILTEAINLEWEGLDFEKIYALQEANEEEELFRYLFVAQCRELYAVLPEMFRKLDDYLLLLLPDNLLRQGSVLERLINTIPEDDFRMGSESWEGSDTIIGWLYQYYISEKHDQVVNINKSIVEKKDIPAATQLWTTDWVVKYIVDNSVGRYWIERNPESQLASKLKYFVPNKDGSINRVDEVITPEDVTVIDPCMGSGHFLSYAFDVLMEIYREYGYKDRDAVRSILNNNLCGLDIDKRAAQLAYFALMMKGCQYDGRFFNRKVQPRVYAFKESDACEELPFDVTELLKDEADKQALRKIIAAFKNAKEYGSIIQLDEYDYEGLLARWQEEAEEEAYSKGYTLWANEAIALVNRLLEQAVVLGGRYAVAATNPPYFNKMDAELKKFVNDNYKAYGSDLFSVFIYRNFNFCKEGGYNGMMTPFVWMFIKTYEKLRKVIIEQKHLSSLIQFEYSAYEEATVPICAFVLQNKVSDDKSLCFRLSNFKGGMEVQRQKVEEALENPKCGYFYEAEQKNFSKIPGAPIAYWVGNVTMFDFPCLNTLYVSGGRNKTHNNEKYLRNWWEVVLSKKWKPYANGGPFRKWYGDFFDLVDWSEEARMFYQSHGGLCKEEFWDKEGITWGAITSSTNSYRLKPKEFIYSSASPTIFNKKYSMDYSVLGFLNTNVSQYISSVINPTLNQNVNNTLDEPYYLSEKDRQRINEIVENNIDISRTDWDSFETSWDFKKHPLIGRIGGRIYRSYDHDDVVYATNEEPPWDYLLSTSFESWEEEREVRFNQLKSNEEELNRIFIKIYGLEEELTPDVEEKDVTVRKADLVREIKSLISYAVGCMFGRYSLDVEGLAYAGGTFDITKYQTFKADDDNIIPICDDEYFADDIVGRFVNFIETAYGKATLEDNLRFIADALGGKGTPREIIRNYFVNDLYSDHCKIYQKRPIYWLFDSGKKNGFKCLVYMHRYQKDTIARIRTDYVFEQQSRYRTRIEELQQRVANAATTAERVRLNKELATFQAKAVEIHAYEEKIHHLADRMISIDLDDGVKHNYEIFADVLAKVK